MGPLQHRTLAGPSEEVRHTPQQQKQNVKDNEEEQKMFNQKVSEKQKGTCKLR
jgi:hypothetical protein